MMAPGLVTIGIWCKCWYMGEVLPPNPWMIVAFFLFFFLEMMYLLFIKGSLPQPLEPEENPNYRSAVDTQRSMDLKWLLRGLPIQGAIILIGFLLA